MRTTILSIFPIWAAFSFMLVAGGSRRSAMAQDAPQATEALPDARIGRPNTNEPLTGDPALIGLREEVRALRQDVQRLLAVLQSQTSEKSMSQTKPDADHRPAEDRIYKRVYATADLVLPVKRVVRVEIESKRPNTAITEDRPDFYPLEELIMSRIDPPSWERAGGLASIEPFPKNLSLVIGQTLVNHQRIAELFAKLRRGPGPQIALQTHIIRPTTAARFGLALSPQKPQLIPAGQALSLLDAAQNDRGTSLIQAPRVTVFPCQVADIRLPASKSRDGLDLLIRADLDEDSHLIRLGLVANADALDAIRSGASLNVHMGESVVIDVTERLSRRETDNSVSLTERLHSGRNTDATGKEQTLVLVTPTIVEAEELLGIPSMP